MGPPQGVIRWRCGLLPNYIGHLFRGCTHMTAYMYGYAGVCLYSVTGGQFGCAWCWEFCFRMVKFHGDYLRVTDWSTSCPRLPGCLQLPSMRKRRAASSPWVTSRTSTTPPRRMESPQRRSSRRPTSMRVARDRCWMLSTVSTNSASSYAYPLYAWFRPYAFQTQVENVTVYNALQ